MNIVALDLEMNNPTHDQRIISIGVTVGDLYNRTILDSKDFFVNPHEQLTDFIKNLCHIKQETVDSAPDLIDSYNQMAEFIRSFAPHPMLIQWGNGDDWQLKRQLNATGLPYEWVFGRTSMNVKNLVQAHSLARQAKSQGGLATYMTRYGLKFEGTKHVSKDDSKNTLLMYYRYLDLIKEINPAKP